VDCDYPSSGFPVIDCRQHWWGSLWWPIGGLQRNLWLSRKPKDQMVFGEWGKKQGSGSRETQTEKLQKKNTNNSQRNKSLPI